MWTFLHTAAASVEDPDALVQLLKTLPGALPCAECRGHVQAYLHERPPEGHIADALTASRYLFELHNAVNLKLGKPEAPARVLHQRHGILLPEALRLSFSAQRIRPYRLI